ncbi:MAG: hypothetical protein WKF57_01490 [Nakamurella sp.]
MPGRTRVSAKRAAVLDHGVDETLSPVLDELRARGATVDRAGTGAITIAVRSGETIDEALKGAVQALALKDAANALSGTLRRVDAVPSPLKMAALAKTEQRWRAIESDYGFLDSRAVGTMRGSQSGNSSAAASKLNATGKALAVARNGLQFPAFQFADDGTIHPVIPKLLTVMATEAGWTKESITLWLTAPNGYLPGGDVPAAHLTDEVAVLRAARAAVSFV